MVRELPIRVHPLDDEPIESWLEAYAARLDIPVAHLTQAIGLRSRLWLWISKIPAEEIRCITDVTGVTAETLPQMTLDRYLEHMPGLRRTERGIERPLQGSRWCPDCLRETGGRWRLRWRLPWSCVCTTHRCLLLSACPQCARRPKSDVMVRPATQLAPGHCREIRDQAGKVIRTEPCGYDLAAATSPRLPGGDPLLAAQHQIDKLLSDPPESPARSVGETLTVRDVLNDASVIADHLLGPPGYGHLADGSAPILTAAMSIVGSADIDEAADLIRKVSPPVEPARRAGATRMALPTGWHRASRRLALAFEATRSLALKPLDRLRLPGGRNDRLAGSDLDDRYRKTPGRFWPSWSLRLMPPDGFGEITYPAALSTFLLLARTGFHRPLRMPGENHGRDTVHCRIPDDVMVRLDAKDHATTVVAVLIELAERLEDGPPVIDYERRRELFLDPDDDLLPERDWTHICKRAGQPAGLQHHLAARYLRNLLTGGEPDPPFTCVGASLTDEPRYRRHRSQPAATNAAYNRFCDHITLPLAQALHAYAEEHLSRHSINEPLTWEPPWDWAPPDTVWPGPHPDDINLDRAHALHREGVPITGIASSLATSVIHVRLALRCHPLPAAPTSSAPNRPKPRVGQLSPDHVRYRYQDCDWSWQQIADEASCSKHTIMDIAREAGITSKTPGRRATITIDPDWLRTEYIDNQRTAPDIAAELGISPQRVRDKARQHGIPLRPRGGSSHAATLQPAAGIDSCPEPYRAAFQGQGAIERVRRFIALADQPTLTSAAQHLGITQTVLTSQLARLEADIGQQLIKRAQPHRPCELTPAGRNFLQHARRTLAVVDVTLDTADTG